MNKETFTKSDFDELIITLSMIADEQASKITDDDKKFEEKLKKMFIQCFVNTAETTVTCPENADIFMITGDIPAMWLRDSSAQVLQYLFFAGRYPIVAKFVRSLIRRQFSQIVTDPYANAFLENENEVSKWKGDITDAKPGVWEHKFELDSLSYPVLLLKEYVEMTDDSSVFTDDIKAALNVIIDIFKTEQNHPIDSKYTFMRPTAKKQKDTLQNEGKGTDVAFTGMTWSGFRPSDDACTYGYNIPENLFVCKALDYICEFAQLEYEDAELADKAYTLAGEIRAGIEKYGYVEDEEFGRMYAYEVDGFGNRLLMDDANVPNLLSLPWLSVCPAYDETYLNTRRFILSRKNPYYFEGSKLKGIGSPHTPENYVWPIALVMQGLTSLDADEKKSILRMLVENDGDTGYMHEGIDVNNDKNFTREHFAWANSLFALFVMGQYRLF